jgi:hypothetical protein
MTVKNNNNNTRHVLAKSFEVRQTSTNPQANGETDFKGSTAVFSTEDRLNFLEFYERIAGSFWENPNWDQCAVEDEQVSQALLALKPQPLPKIRQAIPLTEWRYIGYRPGQREDQRRSLEPWLNQDGVSVADEGEAACLTFEKNVAIEYAVSAQAWRFFLEFVVTVPEEKTLELQLGKIVSHTIQQACSKAVVRFEVDLESGAYNLLVDGHKQIDFQAVDANVPLEALMLTGDVGVKVHQIWGTGYDPEPWAHTLDIPFAISTFIDQNFALSPEITGWQNPEYDDSKWSRAVEVPFAHGGERYKNEDLYMRTLVTVPNSERILLHVDGLDPSGGEIWVNGQPVLVVRNRHPYQLDITEQVTPGENACIAVKVYSYENRVRMRHTAADPYTGWSAGPMTLEGRRAVSVEDVFVKTRSLDSTASTATLDVQLDLMSRDWNNDDFGELKKPQERRIEAKVEIAPWFPVEGVTVASISEAVELNYARPVRRTLTLDVSAPRLWSCESPSLYAVTVTLYDEDGVPIDDHVVTTGIRTVSQDGGVFRINGEPAMMNGALLFGMRGPLDKISQWLRCAPKDWLVREMLMIKALNGNTIRMSVHDSTDGGVNDRRIAEIGDQLGIMFQWTTATWVRTGSPWLLDFEGLPKYIRQVRNHPSIVMWQPANHPRFVDWEDEGADWFSRVVETISAEDDTRLISPTANQGRLHAPSDDGAWDENGKPIVSPPSWTAPNVTRGTMDHATGYAKDWEGLRVWPRPKDWDGEQNWTRGRHKAGFLNSKARAYFDYESEESIGQPNWELRRGHPTYRVKSYEHSYDEGTIGKELTCDEWRLHQAYQAFSAYEAYRKKRWLDYDGMAWCNLRGGGNTGTYQKPLIDYFGYGKMAFYAVRAAFQPVLAGSANVDVVYGPEDEVPVVVMNLGPKRCVDVVVTINNDKGEPINQHRYESVVLPGGRSQTFLKPFTPPRGQDGMISVTYEVMMPKGRQSVVTPDQSEGVECHAAPTIGNLGN